MPINLDFRKRLILNTLLKEREYLSSEDLAELCGVTSRTIRTEVRIISDELEKIGLVLEASPGQGYRVTEESKDIINAEIDYAAGFQPITPDERMFFILKKLIKGRIRIPDLVSEINVSESTLEKDLDRCSSWFAESGINLLRHKTELLLSANIKQLEQISIPYYFGLSRLTGLAVEALLAIDYQSLSGVREGFKDFLKMSNLNLTDDEFAENLISLLRAMEITEDNENKVPDADLQTVATAERLCSCLGEKGVRISSPVAIEFSDRLQKRHGHDYLKFKDVFQIGLNAVLSEYGHPYTDEELLEGLCSITHRLKIYGMPADTISVTIQELEKQYPEALRLALGLINNRIAGLSESTGSSDIVRIGMCFAAFLERNLMRSRKKVVVICSTGIGTSQLISAKLTRLFPNLEILGTFPLHKQSEAELMRPDFIISTDELQSDFDMVRIGNFFSHKDFDKIIPLMRKNLQGVELFRKLSSSDLFFNNIQAGSPLEIIHSLCLLTFGNNARAFEQRVLERESIGSTSVGNMTAIPHAVRAEGHENLISIGILEKPVRWGCEQVQIVFLMILDNPEIDMSSVFEYIYSLVSDKLLMKRVINERDYKLLIRN